MSGIVWQVGAETMPKTGEGVTVYAMHRKQGYGIIIEGISWSNEDGWCHDYSTGGGPSFGRHMEEKMVFLLWFSPLTPPQELIDRAVSELPLELQELACKPLSSELAAAHYRPAGAP